MNAESMSSESASPEQASEQMREFAEQAAEKARAFNEEILESARKIGQEALQRYVEWLQAVAEGQRQLASSPQVSEMDWFASMLKAQADFTEQFAKMVGSASFGQPPQS